MPYMKLYAPQKGVAMDASDQQCACGSGAVGGRFESGSRKCLDACIQPTGRKWETLMSGARPTRYTIHEAGCSCKIWV